LDASIVIANKYLPPSSGFFFAWRKVMTATEKDRDILARTLWGEARVNPWPARLPLPGRSAIV
jgi:hypothetical protein